MLLGALYYVLFCVCLFLWGRTNRPDTPLNLGRFFLVELSAVGALACAKAPFVVYVVVFVVLSLFIAAHFSVSRMLGEPFSHKFYMSVTYLSVLLWYVMAAFLTQPPHTKPIAALIVVVAGLLLTYTKPGRRFWSWVTTGVQNADH